MNEFKYMTHTHNLPKNVNTEFFNESIWSAESHITLHNVSWYADSEDKIYAEPSVLKAYLHDHKISEYASSTILTVSPKNTINLPFGIGEISRANYLHVQMPQAFPTQYNNNIITDYYYFITSFDYINPNTTECTLELDVFATYYDKFTIARMQVERGHIAYQCTTDEYFSNPAEHTNGLLETETVIPRNIQHIKNSEFISLNNDRMLIVFASTMTFTEFATLMNGRLAESSTTDYNNLANTYKFNTKLDYININTSTTMLQAHNDTINTCSMIAFDASAFEMSNTALYLHNYYVHFLNTVQAVYMIPANLVNMSQPIRINNINCCELTQKDDSLQTIIDVNADKFDLPEKYKNLVKLYTGQYSKIIISDNTGKQITVNTEEINKKLSVNTRVSLLYPYISAKMFLNGFNFSKNTEVQFQSLTQRQIREIAGDNYANSFDVDIPSYALFVNAANDYAANSANNIEAQRVNALNTYKQTMNSATTANSNAHNSANTANANAIASADLNVTNTANNGGVSVANQNIVNANNKTNLERSQTATVSINTQNNTTNSVNITYDTELQRELTKIEGDTTAATNLTSTVGNMASAGISGMMSGGGLAGAASGIIGAGISGITAQINNGIIVNAKGEQINAQNANNVNKQTTSYLGIQSNTVYTQSADTDVMTNNNATALQTTTNSANNANTNAVNSANTAKNNSRRSTNTSNTNSDNTYNTTINNARISLQSTKNSVDANFIDKMRNAPIQKTQNSGNLQGIAYDNNGIHIAYVTPYDDEIISIGDYLMLNGYAYHKQITNMNLEHMTNYDYVQGNAVVISEIVPINAMQEIKQQLSNGIRLWHKPQLVNSSDSIYSNTIRKDTNNE